MSVLLPYLVKSALYLVVKMLEIKVSKRSATKLSYEASSITAKSSLNASLRYVSLTESLSAKLPADSLLSINDMSQHKLLEAAALRSSKLISADAASVVKEFTSSSGKTMNGSLF